METSFECIIVGFAVVGEVAAATASQCILTTFQTIAGSLKKAFETNNVIVYKDKVFGFIMSDGLRHRKPSAEDINQSTVSQKKELVKAKRSCLRRCLGCACYSVIGIVVVIALLAGVLKVFYEDETTMFLMRFFRDVSRSKAHARLHGDNSALSVVSVLTGQEELLPMKAPEDEGIGITLEELKDYNGENGSPIYLAIMGRVYDVSRGKSFYGKGRSYHRYVGRDATRSFATGCAKEECLVSSLVGLNDAQRQEAKRWLELFEYHDKYTFIGTVKKNPVDDLVEQESIDQEVLLQAQKMESEFDGATKEGRLNGARKMSLKAKGLYREGNFESAMSYWTSALLFLGEASSDNEIDVVLERADILVTMAAMVQKRGEFPEAHEYYEEVKDGLIAALGEVAVREHAMYGRALSDQAASYYMQKEFGRATSSFKKALDVYIRAIENGETQGVTDADRSRESLRRTHVERANTQFNLAMVLAQQLESNEPPSKSDITSMLTELINLYNDTESSKLDPRLPRIASAAADMREELLEEK